MTGMNEAIRTAVREAIEKTGKSQNEFARSIAYPEAHFSRVINGKRGFLPDVWTRTLDALGLELRVVKKAKPKK